MHLFPEIQLDLALGPPEEKRDSLVAKKFRREIFLSLQKTNGIISSQFTGQG